LSSPVTAAAEPSSSPPACWLVPQAPPFCA
jgi:hypothetical protein